jgi:hypothetical protein
MISGDKRGFQAAGMAFLYISDWDDKTRCKIRNDNIMNKLYAESLNDKVN